MYSTRIKNNRYYVICIAVSDKIRSANFTIDAGAKFTCCPYTSINVDMQEELVVGSEMKFLGEFVKGLQVKFYKLHLKQFTIGNIDMEEQDIWITFDERVTDTVLGMDILQQVIFIANPYNKRIYFCKDRDDYKTNFKLLTA